MGDQVDVIIQQAEAEFANAQNAQQPMGEPAPSPELLQLQELFQQGFIGEEEVRAFCDKTTPFSWPCI